MRKLSQAELDSIPDAPVQSIEPFKSIGDVAKQVLQRLEQQRRADAERNRA